MQFTINTNIASMMVQLSLKKSTIDLNRSIQRMTTGYKINSAKDDAAGYGVAQGMKIKLSSYGVVKKNAEMGTSFLETASNSLELVQTHLQRIRDLTEQAANGTYGKESIDAIQAEISARQKEVDRILDSTEYNGIKVLKANGFIGNVNRISEDDAKAQGYTVIKTADDLKKISSSGKYILMADIDLKNTTWSSKSFSGTFEGNGYSISNLDRALFWDLSGGTIKNLSVQGETSISLALVSQYISSNSTVENVTVTGSVTVANERAYNAGALVAYVRGSDVKINNCSANATVTSAGGNVGVLIGELGTGTITNCSSSGKATGKGNIGGLIGVANSTSQLQIRNCITSADVHGTACEASAHGYDTCAGGFIGGALSNVIITNCEASGNVTARSSILGGFLGNGGRGSLIKNCTAKGNVIGNINNEMPEDGSRNTHSAAFAGTVSGVTIENCDAYGTAANGKSHNFLPNSFATTNMSGVDNIGTIKNCYSATTSDETPFTQPNPNLSAEPTISATPNNTTPLKLNWSYLSDDTSFKIGIDTTNNSYLSVNTGISINIRTLDVKTQQSAQSALDQLDEAIAQITEKQTQIGAMQNRFSSVLTSIEVNNENITSALSTIRDADIAKESSAYIRAQILQQASATLLAVANQAPSIALSLIRGYGKVGFSY